MSMNLLKPSEGVGYSLGSYIKEVEKGIIVIQWNSWRKPCRYGCAHCDVMGGRGVRGTQFFRDAAAHSEVCPNFLELIEEQKATAQEEAAAAAAAPAAAVEEEEGSAAHKVSVFFEEAAARTKEAQDAAKSKKNVATAAASQRYRERQAAAAAAAADAAGAPAPPRKVKRKGKVLAAPRKKPASTKGRKGGRKA